MGDPVRYRFGPLERRGLLLGLRASQLGTLLGGATLAMIALHLGPDGVGAVVGAALMGAAVAACFWRIAGRTPEEWAPLVVTRLIQLSRRETTFISSAPLVGRARFADLEGTLPRPLRGLRVLAVPVTGGEIGAIHSAEDGTYAAVLSVRGRSFALLDTEAKVRLLAQWADVVAGMAREGSAVRRLQWIERTVPDPGDAVGQYLRESIALPHTSPAVRSYLQLVEDAGPTTQQHEAFVVVQVDPARARRAVRQSGGGHHGATALLARETYALATRLQSAELDVVGMMTPRLLAQAIRVSFDPAARTTIAMRNVARPDRPGVAPDQAWPLATETAWHCYHTDSAYHATFWCAEWPRIEVGPDFLAPLLLQTWVHRTVSVTLEPVPPLRAQREVEAARTNDLAGAHLREKHGFLTSMWRRSVEESTTRRAEELAEGHADVRFSGYITVTASDPEELEVACAELEQQAGQCRLVLRRMVGEQDVAFTYTLPLARGLR